MGRFVLPGVIASILSIAGSTRDAVAEAWPEWGAGLHYTHWGGQYSTQGVGGRVRWEPFEYLGVDLTADFLGNEHAFDVPVGFHLYVPLTVLDGWRVRPLAGLCTVISLRRTQTIETSASDDIRFGFRLGAGTEVAVSDKFWLFADAKWERYLGHSRQVSTWSSALDGELSPTDQLAIAIGIGMEL